jgi:hypothetical protein
MLAVGRCLAVGRQGRLSSPTIMHLLSVRRQWPLCQVNVVSAVLPKTVAWQRQADSTPPPTLRDAAGWRAYMLAVVWIVHKVCCRTFSSRLVDNCASVERESPCGPGHQPLG